MDRLEAWMLPIPDLTFDDVWRFNLNVDKSGDCWIWEAKQNGDGYGLIKIKGKVYLTHRVAWRIFHKEDPGAVRLLHSCNNPSCVNPVHLRKGSQAENNAQAFADGRKSCDGVLNPSAKLRKCDVLLIREMHTNGIPQREIRKRFNWVSKSTIKSVIARDSWRSV